MKRCCAFILYAVRISGIVLHEAFEMKEAVFIHGLETDASFPGAYPYKFSLYKKPDCGAQYKLDSAGFSFTKPAFSGAFHAPEAHVTRFYRYFLSVKNNASIKQCLYAGVSPALCRHREPPARVCFYL